MRFYYLLVLLLFSGLVFTSCGKNATSLEEEDPTADLLPIGIKSDNGLQVEMFAEDSLKVGLNNVYFRLTDESSNELITEARITQKIVMHMPDYSHGCPFIDSDSLANADNIFECEIVFIMASGMMGSWDDTVSVHNTQANTLHTVVFDDISVRETNMKKNLVYTDIDSNQTIYIVTLNSLSKPMVGSNEFTLTVHKKETMMNFPPATDMKIVINPQMPDMGHGSEGNVNPTHTENGKYTGTVVFNMSGYWTVDFNFMLDGVELGTIQYEFNF